MNGDDHDDGETFEIMKIEMFIKFFVQGTGYTVPRLA